MSICQKGLVIDDQELLSEPQATRINLDNIELVKNTSGIQSTGNLLQIMLYVALGGYLWRERRSPKFGNHKVFRSVLSGFSQGS